MDNQGFYVDLVSNASMDIYPENACSSFKVKLRTPIELTDDWMVATTEVFYPLSVLNVRKKVRISLRYIYTSGNRTTTHSVGTGSKKFYLEAGHYKSIRQLVVVLNSIFEEIWDNKTDTSLAFLTSNCSFLLNSNQKIGFKYGYTSVVDKTYAFFPDFHPLDDRDNIEAMLGFKKGYIDKSALSLTPRSYRLVAEDEPDIRHGSNFIFIYTDIIRERLFGDTSASLLRVVPLYKGLYEDIGYAKFNPPFYYPISRNRIETIEIYLCDETGHQLPFSSGRVHINLHFRPKE